MFFLLKSEWQQVSSGLQGSSQYSGRYRLVLQLPIFPVSFPSLPGPFQPPQLQIVSPSPSRSAAFLFSSKIQVQVPLFTFFEFHSMIRQDGKIHNIAGSIFFLVKITEKDLLYGRVWLICLYLKFSENFMRLIL